MLRRLGAILAGLLAGLSILIGILSKHRAMYPPPQDLNFHDKEGILAHMQSLPDKAFIMVIVAHTLSTLAGAFVAARIAPNHKIYYGIFVGALFVVASLSMIMSVPHPRWMILTDILLVTLLAYLGAKLGSKGNARQIP